MASHHDLRNDPKSVFSFGARELRGAKKVDQRSTLGLVEPVKGRGPSRGFDPYNTSGSVDRANHWAHIPKR